MVSDLDRVRLLLAEVSELSAKQSDHFESNRLVEMLKCQQERTAIFNELVELSLEKYIDDPRVKHLVGEVLRQDKQLTLNIETTVGEHKEKISSIRKGAEAIRAYSK